MEAWGEQESGINTPIHSVARPRNIVQEGRDVWQYSRCRRFGRVFYRVCPEEVCMVLRSSHLVGEGNVIICDVSISAGRGGLDRLRQRHSGVQANATCRVLISSHLSHQPSSRKFPCNVKLFMLKRLVNLFSLKSSIVQPTNHAGRLESGQVHTAGPNARYKLPGCPDDCCKLRTNQKCCR